MRISRFVIWVLVFAVAGSLTGMAARAADGDKTVPATAPVVRPADEKGMKLIWAASDGNLDEALALIKQGADVNATTKRGSPPLHFASSCRFRASKLEIAKVLVEHGAKVNGRGIGGITALHEASTLGNSELVAYLLSKGADVNAKETSTGDTPLHGAVYVFGSILCDPVDQLKIINLLLSNGADVNAVDKDGETPLDLLNEKSKDNEVAKMLQAKGGKSGKEIPPPATQKSP